MQSRISRPSMSRLSADSRTLLRVLRLPRLLLRPATPKKLLLLPLLGPVVVLAAAAYAGERREWDAGVELGVDGCGCTEELGEAPLAAAAGAECME